MPIASGDLIQATYRYLVDGQLNENVVMFRERGGPFSDAQIGGDILKWLDIVHFVQSGAATYLQPTWKRMTPVAFDEQFVPLGSTTQGNVGGGAANSMLACCCTLRTGVAGKSHRGRVYIGGLAGGAITPDRLSNGYQTDFNTMASDLMAAFDDAAGTALYLALGIYSRLIGGTNPMTVAGWQAVTQIIPQNIVASQRRRRVGVGV
jgi:hypothetical protein